MSQTTITPITYEDVYDFRKTLGDEMLSGEDIIKVYDLWQKYLTFRSQDPNPELLRLNQILTSDQIKRVHDISNCQTFVEEYSRQLRDFVPRETIVKHLEEEKLTLRTLYDTKV
jgi:hypothetical protein